MGLRFEVGDRIDISINGARIESMNDVGIAVCSLPDHAWRPTVNLRARGVNVTLTRPRNWPPQPGDLWLSGGCSEWAAAAGDRGRVVMVPLNGDTSLGNRNPESVLNDAPVKLVYRKGWSPTPAAHVEAKPGEVDEPKPAGPVGRAATIAGLRELADFFEARPNLPIDAYTVDARRYIRHDKRLDTDDAKHAELERLAAIMGVEPMDREKAPYPEARHRYAVKKFSGGVSYEVILTDAWVAPEPAPDVAPPAGDAVVDGVAAPSTTAPDFDLGPVSDEAIDGALTVLAQALDADPSLLDDPAPAEDLSVAVTGAEDVAVEDLRTPDEWQLEYAERQIMDPDGWRGVNGRPWTDPISREEFLRRRNECTMTGPIGPDADGDLIAPVAEV